MPLCTSHRYGAAPHPPLNWEHSAWCRTNRVARTVRASLHSSTEDAVGHPPHRNGVAPHPPLRWGHRDSAKQIEWHERYGQGGPSVPQPDNSMFVPIDSRESSGSARSRLPYGVSLSRNRIKTHGTAMARRKKQTSKQTNRKFEDYLDAQEREHVLYKLAYICATMMRDNRGVVGNVARAVGGPLVAPLIDPTHIQRYFGDLKSFGAVCQ